VTDKIVSMDSRTELAPLSAGKETAKLNVRDSSAETLHEKIAS